MEDLAEKVEALFEGDAIEQALAKPEAAALISNALSAASRSFGQTKLDALRNAAINGVFYSPDNVDLTAVVLGLLDRLTDSHIQMLSAVAEEELRTMSHVPWGFVRSIGIEVRSSPDGLRRPVAGLGFRKGDLAEGWIDEAAVETNQILAADLQSLGLLMERLSTVPSVLEWSTNPRDNLPGFAQLTRKGQLLMEHIRLPADVG